MNYSRSQKGFTLVELAIVMTIIGLLIGGILKGQELMENARVTATIAQVKAYEAAATTFRDSYNAFPGDLTTANIRIPKCTLNCNAPAATGGNSIVGAPGWGAAGYAIQLPVTGMANPPTTAGEETQLFWTHLLLTDLISGVTDAPVNGVTVPAWGDTHPAARIGGGFIVGYADGTIGVGGLAQAAGTGLAGTVLHMWLAPNTAPIGGGATAGQQPLTPAKAAQIDRKMDDGRPGSGFVQAYGVPASCMLAQGAGFIYAESVTTKDCGLMFRIQG